MRRGIVGALKGLDREIFTENVRKEPALNDGFFDRISIRLPVSERKALPFFQSHSFASGTGNCRMLIDGQYC